MTKPTLILASGSPRRRELLKQIGLEFHIVPSRYEEHNGHNLKPHELVMHLAEGKARDVYESLAPTLHQDFEEYIILGADTLTFYKEKPIGKPANAAEAKRILQKFSGTNHKVMTGIALIDGKTGNVVTDYESTLVHFVKMSSADIDEYIATGEPLDKAGAYAIQGIGGKYISDIQGCYSNVVGLPLAKVRTNLRKLGYKC